MTTTIETTTVQLAGGMEARISRVVNESGETVRVILATCYSGAPSYPLPMRNVDFDAMDVAALRAALGALDI